VYQVGISKGISPTCFGAYCTILRENFVYLLKNVRFYKVATLVVLQNITRTIRNQRFIFTNWCTSELP